jgi:hypothetical protein
MRSAFMAIACAALLAACAHAGRAGPRDGIPLPRPLAAGERVVLEVELGMVAAGTRIVLRTPDGRLIGTVSPHGIRHGAGAGTYSVPVPHDLLVEVLRDGRIHLQLLIEPAGAEARHADADDIRSVRASILPD